MLIKASSNRPFVPISYTPPESVMEVFDRLQATFQTTTIFGGCLRDSYIGRIPFYDIDAWGVISPTNPMPPELCKALSEESSQQAWKAPSADLRGHFHNWTGLHLKKFSVQDGFYRFPADTGGSSPLFVDLSVVFTNAANSQISLAETQLSRASSPFSSIAMTENGILAHKDFERDAAAMQFSIFRDHGLRRVIWSIPYYERLKAKYPDLKLTNPEAIAYKAFTDLKGQQAGIERLSRQFHFIP